MNVTINDKINLVLRMQLFIVEALGAGDAAERYAQEARDVLAQVSEREEYRDIVSDLLTNVGIPQRIRGYAYLVEAITRAAKDPKVMEGVTDGIYSDIATMYGSTPGAVSRSIRSAVEAAFTNCDYETLGKYFGSSASPEKGRLTNVSFMRRMAEIARRIHDGRIDA